MSRSFGYLLATLILIASSALNASAQYEKRLLRKGVQLDVPVNSIATNTPQYDLELANMQYGYFIVAIEDLTQVYANDKTRLKRLEQLADIPWKKRKEDQYRVLQREVLTQLTVLDALNPVHSLERSYGMQGKYETMTISFKKRITQSGREMDYEGKCVGYLIPERNIAIRLIHYYDPNTANDDLQKVQKRFFLSLKIKR